MKKVLITVLFSIGCITAHSQIISQQDLEAYADIGNTSWSDMAKSLYSSHQLNELGELSISTIKEYNGQSRKQLYDKVLNWIISISPNAKSTMQALDEDEGKIITRCYLPNIAKRTMGDNSYRVSIRPLLRFDFKEGRIRIIYTLQNYEVLKIHDDGGYIMMFGSFGVTGDGVTKDTQIWALKDCYPFAEKRWKHPKVTSSRAFYFSLISHKILIDKLDTLLTQSSQTDDDEW